MENLTLKDLVEGPEELNLVHEEDKGVDNDATRYNPPRSARLELPVTADNRRVDQAVRMSIILPTSQHLHVSDRVD